MSVLKISRKEMKSHDFEEFLPHTLRVRVGCILLFPLGTFAKAL